MNQPPKTGNLTWALLGAAVVFVYFYGLGIPLIGPDEPRYSQVAREMFERGDWVTPTLGGYDWFEKPALLYWLQIVAYGIFGVTEFAARFGSALFGLGTVVCLWIYGRAAVAGSENTGPGEDFPYWLALVGASAIGLISFSRGASFDIILTFPIAASLTGFFVWDRNGSRAGLVAFYAFMGLSVIAKGLVGFVFPPAIVGFYYVLQWRWPARSTLLSLVWGIPLSVAVACLWYFPMYQVNGWKFIDDFIIQHHFQRYTSNKYLHPQPFWFFWIVVPLMTIPWIPFFFAGIWKIARDFKKSVAEPSTAFALSWILVPLVFFSASGSKLPGYILPVLPAAMFLAAGSVYAFAARGGWRPAAVRSVALLTFAVVVILLRFVVVDFLKGETAWHLIETANARGYTAEKIANMHAISHSAEFYGAGRLIREPDGKQRKFYGVVEIVDQMNRDRTDSILVLVPDVYLYTLTKGNEVMTEVLDDNGEFSIVIVKRKP